MKKFLFFALVLLSTSMAFAMDDTDQNHCSPFVRVPSRLDVFLNPLSLLDQLHIKSVMDLMDPEDCRDVMNSVHPADILSRVDTLIKNNYIILKSFYWTDEFSPVVKATLLLPADQIQERAAVLGKYGNQALMSEANSLVIALALKFPASVLGSSFVEILRCVPQFLRVIPEGNPWKLNLALQLVLCELNMFPRESSSLELSDFPPAVLERNKPLNLRSVQDDRLFARYFLPLEQTTWFSDSMPDDERSRIQERILRLNREELVELSRCVPWLFVKGMNPENQTWSLQDALKHLIKVERHVVIARKVSARSLPDNPHRKKDIDLRVHVLRKGRDASAAAQ